MDCLGEIKEQLVGGDAGSGKYSDYANLNDVYGVTSNLKVYYCSNGLNTIYGILEDNLDKDNPARKVFDSKNSLMSILSSYDTNGDGELSLEEVNSIEKLELNSENFKNGNFKEFYNLVNLSELRLSNLLIDNFDGIENCNKLKYISFTECSSNDYSNIGKMENILEYLYFYSVEDSEFTKIINGLKDYSMTNLHYLAFTTCSTNVVNSAEFWRFEQPLISMNSNLTKKLTSINYLDKLSPGTKSAVRYLTVSGNNLISLEGLENFENLYLLRAECNNITNLENIKSLKKLLYLMMDKNSLTDLADFSEGSKLYYFSGNNNANLTSLSGFENCFELKYLNCLSCDLGNDVDSEKGVAKTNALKSLNNLSLIELRLSNNVNLKWISYIKNSESTLTILWLNGCSKLSDLIDVKEMLTKLGNNLKISSEYSLLLLEKNSTFLDLNGQTLKKENFLLLSSYEKLNSLSLEGVKILSDDNLEISDYDTEIKNVLNNMTNMKYLNLKNLSKLTNIDFIKNMKELKELDLRGTNVIDLTVLEEQTIEEKLDLSVLGVDKVGTDLSKIPNVVSNCNDSDSYWTRNNNTAIGGLISNQNVLLTLEDSNITSLWLDSNCTTDLTLDLSGCSKLTNFRCYHIAGSVTYPKSLKWFYTWGIWGQQSFHLATELSYAYHHGANDISNFIGFLKNVKKVEELHVGWGGTTALCLLQQLEGKGLSYFHQNICGDGVLNLKSFILPSSLTKLIVGKNNVGSYSVNDFPSTIIGFNGSSLETIEMYGLEIGNANFIKDIPTLDKVVLRDCKVTSIDFASDNKITYLDLKNCSISNLKSFEKLKLCTYINLENNQILPNSSFVNEKGENEIIGSLLVLAYLNPNNQNLPNGMKKGALTELYLANNPNLSDFSAVSGLHWQKQSGF